MVMLRMLTFRPATLEQTAVKPAQIQQAAAKTQMKTPQPDAGQCNATNLLLMPASVIGCQ